MRGIFVRIRHPLVRCASLVWLIFVHIRCLLLRRGFLFFAKKKRKNIKKKHFLLHFKNRHKREPFLYEKMDNYRGKISKGVRFCKQAFFYFI